MWKLKPKDTKQVKNKKDFTNKKPIIQKKQNHDLIKKMGAYFSTFSYNSQDNNQLNLTSNFCSNHDVN